MSKGEKTAKATIAVTLIIFLSKAFGFVRESIIAAYFGTGMEADAYTAAYGTYYVPILLLGSCISSTLIPLYVSLRSNQGPRHANRLASNTLNLFSAFGLIVAALMFLFAGPILSVLYSGFGAEQHALTVELLRIMLPGLGFAIAALVLSNILNAQEHFTAAQLTGFPLSVCTIVASVFFSQTYGIRAVAWGVFATGLMQVLIQLPPLLKSFRYHWVFDPADPMIRKMIALAVPAILSMSATEINSLVDKSMASGLGTGSLSAMNYAFRLVSFVQGILVVPLMTVTFSRMSRRAAGNDKGGVVKIFRESSEVICSIVLPVTIIACILSRGVIRFAFMRGEFNEHSLMLTSGVFSMYIIGELFFGVRDLLNRVFHSMQDTKTPMYVALFMILINILLNLLFKMLWGLNGLALSTTVSGVISCVLLMALLRRKAGHIGLKTSAPEYLKILAASLAAGAFCLLLRSFVPEPSGFIAVFGYLALLGGSSMLVYVAAAWIFGSRNVRSLGRMFRRG
ncbi:MAG: murein biosynthesis integral membrane protein MurJ [Eubacteriales bacterium]|nr:murein biosynthesis integral membrane protein MurJ [Eubacteriales bacterium]